MQIEHISYLSLVSMAADEEDSYCQNECSSSLFAPNQELVLKKYLKTVSQMNCELSSKKVRQLVFEMATRWRMFVPDKWKSGRIASKEWLYGFMLRHPELKIKEFESCGISCSDLENNLHIKRFFQKLKKAYKLNSSFGNGSRVFNLDEIPVSTMQQSGRRKDAPIGSIITICCIINACGSFIPPAIVFPCPDFDPGMVRDAPVGTLGLANPSGWMSKGLFARVIQHFIECTQSSKSNPSLLIIDNHESHLSVDVLDLARSNGVMILTFHPHYSDVLQPLDIAVFAPFKTLFYSNLDVIWSNPRAVKRGTIDDIVMSITTTFKDAVIPQNIKAGFKEAGIFPYSVQAFKAKFEESPDVSGNKMITATVEEALDQRSSADHVPKAEVEEGLNEKRDLLGLLEHGLEEGATVEVLNCSSLEDASMTNFLLGLDVQQISVVTEGEVEREKDSHEKQVTIIEHDAHTVTPLMYTLTPGGIFKCSKCDFETSVKKLIKKHSGVHAEKYLSCPDCNYKCTARKLRQHRVIHTSDKPYKCGLCPYECNFKIPLKMHMLKHAGIFKFKCSACSFVTNTRGALKSHEVVHSGEKAFKCGFCSFERKHVSTLKKHLVLKHGIYTCSKCKYEGTSKENMKNHYQLDHGSKFVYECTLCFYVTDRLDRYTLHVKGHSTPKSNKRRKRKRKL